MIETLLVATDGSEAAGAAERFAVSLAARLKAKLRGLTVIEERVLRGIGDSGLGIPKPPTDGLEGFCKARADAICRRLLELARGRGVECTCDTARGIADDVIVERGEAADLLVLGRDGENSAFRTALIGPTTDAVIRKTHKPAVVVPEGAELTGPVLLAFDGSPGSVLAAELAVEIANRLGEPLHVFVDSKDKGRAVNRFDEVRKRVGALHVPVHETSSTLGRPDVKIVDSAREARAGLVIMGAFGRSRISEYFLGSNSAAVVRTSPIAVLLAR
jgi:nucleotide-binding universal stress UspA family protein